MVSPSGFFTLGLFEYVTLEMPTKAARLALGYKLYSTLLSPCHLKAAKHVRWRACELYGHGHKARGEGVPSTLYRPFYRE